jgi:hypothetical protein
MPHGGRFLPGADIIAGGPLDDLEGSLKVLVDLAVKGIVRVHRLPVAFFDFPRFHQRGLGAGFTRRVWVMTPSASLSAKPDIRKAEPEIICRRR